MPRKKHKSPPQKSGLKNKKLSVDIKAVEQGLLEPFVPFQFDISKPEGFNKFTHDLIRAALEHQIDNRVGSMVNGAVANYIRYQQPPQGTQVNVTQVAVDPEQIITGFLNTLPAELRNAIVAYGRKQAKLEQVTPAP
jgi:hypothetical protein